MASDYDKVIALRRFLKREKTSDEIKTIATSAFAALQAGKTVTSVSFEGGSTSAIINCDPAALLNACEDVLAELGETDAVSSASRSIFTKFNAQTLQT